MGEFKPNVLVQIKNGVEIDLQLRELFDELVRRVEEDALVSAEGAGDTGTSRSGQTLVDLGTMWKEFFYPDMVREGEGIDGGQGDRRRIDLQRFTGSLGVNQTGSSTLTGAGTTLRSRTGKCGSGCLAWKLELTADGSAHEWTAHACFTTSERLLETIRTNHAPGFAKRLMNSTRRRLGLHHLIGGNDYDLCRRNAQAQRADWTGLLIITRRCCRGHRVSNAL